MASGAYIGVNGVARKITNGYVGVSGVARKIKKAYIGIGGVARPCWAEGGGLAYYGTIAGLSAPRYDVAAVSIGDYALFGGGWSDSDSGLSDAVTTYNSSLVRGVAPSLSEERGGVAATTVGNYALFAGGVAEFEDMSMPGMMTQESTDTVEAYDTSFTKTVVDSLSEYKNNAFAAKAGNYALFGGGYDYNACYGLCNVDAYNASLTRTSVPSLREPRYDGAAASVGNYALFGGGECGTDMLLGSTAVYSASLTRSNISTGTKRSRTHLAAASIGNYALFGGGYSDGAASALVDVYDSSLTRTDGPVLSNGRCELAATAISQHVIFAGGCYFVSDSLAAPTVDVYDSSFTQTTAEMLSEARSRLSGVTVGNYALFGGGLESNGFLESTVDVYEFL